jgi:hypothetical protein
MVKVKNKKQIKSQSLGEFLHNKVNLVLIILTVVIVGMIMLGAIADLSITSGTVECRVGDVRPLGQAEIDNIHHYAKETLWFCGIVLGTLVVLLVYRNKYSRIALIIILAGLIGYWGLGKVGMGVGDSLLCWDF